MAGQMSIMLRADPSEFDYGIEEARNAVETFVDAAESGAEGADQAFAEVIRTLVQLGIQSGRSGDQIVSDLRKLGLTAEDAEDAVIGITREMAGVGDSRRDIERAEDAVDDLGDAAEDSAEKTEAIGDAAESSADKTSKLGDVAGEAGDSVRDLGDIAKDALAGDFSGAVDGALSALGTLAISAGIGGAAGSAVIKSVTGMVDTVMAVFTDYQNKVDEVRDSTMAALVEMAGAFDETEMQKRMTDIVNDTDKWNQAMLIQQQTGLDMGVVLAGLAGDADAAAEASAAFADVWDQIPGSVDTQVMWDAKASLEGVNDALAGAPAKVDAVSSGMNVLSDRADDANQRLREVGESLLKVPPTTEANLVLKVDRSAWDRFRNEPKQFDATVRVRPGEVRWE